MPFGHGFISFRRVRIVNQTCFSFLVFTLSSLSIAAPVDFWDKSPELKKDLFEKRRILVSVTNTKTHTEFKGVGLVNTKFEKIWAFATNPAKVKEFARDLEKFEWDIKTGDCYAGFKILWKLFEIKAKTELRPKADPPQIAFDFVEGSWVTLNGRIEMKPHGTNQTVVILRAQTPEGQFANWHFAMEAVLHRIASSLREAVEKD